SLIFGILLLVLPAAFWEQFARLFNRPVLAIDQKLRTHNFVIGFVFLIVGTWTIFFALQYPELWFLQFLGVPLVIFGLFYVFLPDWASRFSTLAEQTVITFDQVAIGSRVSLGIVLILAAIYIFLRLAVASRI
ncbi:MAG: hypothetical protein KJ732_05095, partial [Candidatus Margulisbacteria bacterium]|nr:hypothetical protein [Candidatus Margulisiibacteriota bacterium]